MNPRHLVKLLIVILGTLPAFAFAQTAQPQYFLPQPFPRSPNATAFEKYGTYQVNEFTGIPDISIPLYTIEAGGFKIPITLSYHASGVKVTDVASWAGLGWSVSAGGQISRKTMGLPDDDVNGYLDGNLWNVNQVDTANRTTAGLQYLENVSNGSLDAKPDIYSYDFPGHSGKFFFDGSPGQNYAPRFMPWAPLKLTHSPSNGTSTITITDEHGNVYMYGGTGAIETTFSETGGGNEHTANSAWKMSQMLSQNRRDTVSFTYQQDHVTYPSADGEIYTVVDQVPFGSVGYSASYSGAPSTPGNFNSTTEELPQQINFPNGKVVFEQDTAHRKDVSGAPNPAYRLKDIKVYQYNYALKTMELQRTIVFYHGYFFSGGSYRLRLDSIQLQDKGGSIVQHYRFGYNTSISLPAYTSPAQDFWGYYNGCDGSSLGGITKNNNTMLTPTQTITYNSNGGDPEQVTIGQADRKPDSNYMQAFVLDTIKYPTGGYSTFSYQTNQFVTGSIDSLAGGLRIHTISSYDGVNSTPIVKTYVYNTSRKNYYMSYAYFAAQQTHRHYDPSRGTGIPTQDGQASFTTYSSSPHCDLEAFDGAIVVYPSVTEYIGTPGTNIGRTDYLFSDKTDQTETASFAGSIIYYSFFYDRGHLVSKKDYIHKSDGTYQIVRSDTSSYGAFVEKYYPYVGLAVKRMFYNDGATGNPIPPLGASPDDTNSFMWSYYDIYTGDTNLTATISKVYDTNDPTKYTTSTTSYIYDDTTHVQLVKIIHTDSKGNTHITSNKYAYDYLSGSTTHNAVLDSMISRNMYGDVIEKWDSLKNVTTSLNGVTGGQLNQYKTGSQGGSIVPATISTLSAGSPLTNFTPSSVNSGTGVLSGDSRYVKMISFDYYDGLNNIIQFTPRNANPTSILWDYQSENPIAQVKNASLSTYYAYTSFEANGKGNWTYSGTPVPDVTAPTGAMVYPLSSGNITVGTSGSVAYVLSMWSNNGPPTVYAGSFLTGIAMTAVNGWTYYEYQVPTGAGSVSISGSMSIDELRLYPANAQMITYAYAPEGVTTIADTKGGIQHFEYDYFHRLKNIKDFYGNIVNNYSYHTYDQTIGNDAQSGTLTRNNCPPNTSPGSLTYTVPANKYYSSTKASANAEAIYDVNTNGQAKANQYCGCPIIYISITVTNSSGISGFPITFSGLPQYTVPTGTSTISVPQGMYSTVIVGPFGSGTHNYTLGAYVPQNGVHSATFNSVQVGPTFTITIN